MIKFLLVFIALFPISALAQQATPLAGSNWVCTDTYTGPKIVSVTANQQQDITTSAISIISKKIKAIDKSVKKVKSLISSRKNVKENKKKLSILNRDKKFQLKVLVAARSCLQRPPLIQSVPTISTIAPPPLPPPPPPFNPPPITPTPIATIYSTPTPFIVPSTVSPDIFYALVGCLIYADDNTYLGIFSSNKFLYESIANEFGPYGGQFGAKSIFNQFGTYGSQFSNQSPWNQFTTTPPIIYCNGEGTAYLSRNTFKTPRVDPYDLAVWIDSF